jgi:hypothetical protein
MYASPNNAATAAPTTSLAQLRQDLLVLTFTSPYLTAAERVRANHNAYECEDAERLARWIRNTQAELARREEAQAVRYCTMAQREEINLLLQQPHVTRQKKTKILLHINRLTEEDAAKVIADLATGTPPAPKKPGAAQLVAKAAAVADYTRCPVAGSLRPAKPGEPVRFSLMLN